MKNKDTNEFKQSDIFLKSEANAWFERNKKTLKSKSNNQGTETIKRTLQSFKDKINTICEIGCGNGIKLNDLCDFFKASGFGIDPSKNAVNEGNESYKNINLAVSTSTDLPFNDSQFDLVFFGFCMYLIDRVDMFKTVAEADRVLKAGGFLAILDFDPKLRHKRLYHHKHGIFSYKTAYSDFFTNSGHYYIVAKESFSHNSNFFSTDSDERISICILYKEPEAY